MLDETPSEQRCALCGEMKATVQLLTSGPHAGLLICQDCLGRVSGLTVTPDPASDADDEGREESPTPGE